ncbi:MAG: hypothetical protein JWM47_4160 [Acidimicrobiales bacterium]|jgi:hypothetical protein|nr:hypothetical protein [Acidimicrobiales bacterium]
MTGLTFVIRGCTVMTYGPCKRPPESRTSEPRTPAIGAIRSIARSGRPISARLFDFSSASLSLFATGSAIEGASAGDGIEAGVHGKAARQLDSACAVVRICQKNLDQRSRDSSAASVPATRGRSWLSRSQPRRAAFNWSIALIACRQTSWLRYISCLCPIDGEQSDVRPPTIQLLRR